MLGSNERSDWGWQRADRLEKALLKERGKRKKYEKALISIAAFGNGSGPETGEIEVPGTFDEPCSAEEARRALGKTFCKKFKTKGKGDGKRKNKW